MILQRMTWPQVRDAAPGDKIFILPLGAVEQHGLHLPLMTDTAIISAIAEQVEARMPDELLVLPVLWCGHSTHHLAFPGTASVSQDHYQAMIVDLCSSMLTAGARKIFLMNGHGGNDIPVRFALRELKSRFPDPGIHTVFASYWHIAGKTLSEVRESDPGGMGHACEMETSIMMHLHPELVRTDQIRRDGPRTDSVFRKGDMQQGAPVYECSEFHEISETGTVGHPDLASAEKGKRFLDGTVEEIVAFLRDFQTWD